MRKPLTDLSAYEDTLRYEVRRIGAIPGFDGEDLQQEARMAALYALKQFDVSRQTTGKAFVATAVRNKLINVKRAALTNGRVPRDEHGCYVATKSLDAPAFADSDVTMLDSTPTSAVAADDSASANELIRALDARMSKQDMQLLVSALLTGAEIGTKQARGKRVNKAEIERVRMVARAALLRLTGQRRMLTDIVHRVDTQVEVEMKTTTKVTLPVVDENAPDCHASRAEGPGYDAGEASCRNQCGDKFSCLRDLVNNNAKNTEGLTLDADTEIKAVLEGVLSLDDASARMKERNSIESGGGKVPDSLSTKVPYVTVTTSETVMRTPKKTKAAAAPKTPEPTDDDKKPAEPENTEAPEKEDATMTTKSTAKKTKAAAAPKPPKAAKPAKAPKPPKAVKAPKAAKVGKPRIEGKRTALYTQGTRFLPQPRELNEEQLVNALARVKLGQPFDLAIGMEIVRKKRDGSEVVVKIAKNGFVMDDVVYSSLSAAGQYASLRAVSGNDYFNVESYSCTEIRGKGVPGGVYSKAGEGKAAVVGAHVTDDAKPKKAAKAPAKKATKKATKKAPPPPPKKAAKKAPAKKAAKKGSKK